MQRFTNAENINRVLILTLTPVLAVALLTNPMNLAVPVTTESNDTHSVLELTSKNGGGQLPKCVKFCPGIEVYGRFSLKNERL